MTLEVAVEPFRIGLRVPVQTARGTVLERSGWIVVLRDGSYWGRGEVAPLPGWATVDARTAHGQLRSWASRTALDARLAPSAHLAPEVRAGIDAARHSLDAARADEPLWRHLGGASGEVAVNHLAVGSTPASLADHAAAEVGRGARVLKIKLGLRDDEARLRAVVAVLEDLAPGQRADGHRVVLRLDANAAWPVPEAIDRLGEIQAAVGDRLDYIEDPVATLDGLARLRRSTDVPVAVDELVRSRDDVDRVVGEGLAEVVVIKPPMVGGISATRELADHARAGGVAVVVSSLYDGPVGLAAWCHLAASIGGGRAHGLGTASLLAGDLAGHLEPIDGRIVLPG